MECQFCDDEAVVRVGDDSCPHCGRGDELCSLMGINGGTIIRNFGNREGVYCRECFEDQCEYDIKDLDNIDRGHIQSYFDYGRFPRNDTFDMLAESEQT